MAISLLLADDSPTIAKILGMALQNEDYEIRSVLTAEEALRELRAKPPYFFLVDLSLPSKNGFEFAELIRADSKLSKIKIVFLSSAFEPVDEDAVKKSGADLVIAKPFDPSELRNGLRQLRDAPPKFPSGSKVEGALSGQVVTAPAGGGTSLTDTGLRAAREVIAASAEPEADDLLASLSANLDANTILAGLSDTPPAAPLASDPGVSPAIDLSADLAAVSLDFGEPPSAPPAQDATPTLDLTGAFTPGLGTATNIYASTPPASPPTAKAEAGPPPFTAPAAKPAPPSKAAPKPQGLSPNAEALAAFFAAEIDSKKPAAPAPPPPASVPTAPPEDFEKSLASIEWDASGPADLDAWSASPQAVSSPGPQSNDQPPKAPPRREARPAAPTPSAGPRAEIGAASAAHLFDTGGSNFRFAEDYISRITRSFTGDANEEVAPKHAPMFPQESHDTPPASAPAPAVPAAGPSGWNPVDAERMEQIVREEVQMAVREIVEKVAWEVIPELAENIIKKELDKVMKQLEGNS